MMGNNTFSQAVKESIGGDEYYSPQNVVDMIVPYVLSKGYRKIWCPFDTEESLFVKTFEKLGCEVIHGHISTGNDFFAEFVPKGEIVVSNPPFSHRDRILEKLFYWDFPFALVTNFNGLFDSKKRHFLFSEHRCEIIVPKGRMNFISATDGLVTQPSFQSVYVCNKLIDKQIIFDNTEF